MIVVGDLLGGLWLLIFGSGVLRFSIWAIRALRH